jgi:hypothetical protein
MSHFFSRITTLYSKCNAHDQAQLRTTMLTIMLSESSKPVRTQIAG